MDWRTAVGMLVIAALVSLAYVAVLTVGHELGRERAAVEAVE